MRPRARFRHHVVRRTRRFLWTNTWLLLTDLPLVANTVNIAQYTLSPTLLPLPAPWNGDLTLVGVRGIWTLYTAINVHPPMAVLTLNVDNIGTPATFRAALAPVGTGGGYPRGDFLVYSPANAGPGGQPIATASRTGWDTPINNRTARKLKGGEDVVYLEVTMCADSNQTASYSWNLNLVYKLP